MLPLSLEARTVARPLPQIASFFLALIAAHAGLAVAGPSDAPSSLAAVLPRPVPTDSPAQSVPTDRFNSLAAAAPTDSPAQPVPADTRHEPDWPTTIAARLATLRAHPRPLPAAEAQDARLLALRQQLAAVVRRAGGARIGVHVRDLDSGRALFDHRGDEHYNPASNQKLVTAIAAVELLGPDYRFATRVLRVDDALILVGEGDPSLQLADLHALASELVAAGAHLGVRRILVDDTAFSPERYGPGYSAQGDGASYTAPSGALSLAFNTAVATIRPTTPGQPASVDLSPASAHLRLQGEIRTGRGRELRVVSRDADDLTVFELDGALPAGHAPVTVRRRIADPALFTGHAFAELLRQLTDHAAPLLRGHRVDVDVEVRRQVPPARQVHVERVRLVLGQDLHLQDPGVHQVRQDEVDQPVAPADRHRGFGPVGGQREEPFAFATRQHDREDARGGPLPVLERHGNLSGAGWGRRCRRRHQRADP